MPAQSNQRDAPASPGQTVAGDPEEYTATTPLTDLTPPFLPPLWSETNPSTSLASNAKNISASSDSTLPSTLVAGTELSDHDRPRTGSFPLASHIALHDSPKEDTRPDSITSSRRDSEQTLPDSLRIGSLPTSPEATTRRFSWASTQYETLSPTDEASPGGIAGRMRSIRSAANRLARRPTNLAIPEHDEIDMGLLANAAAVSNGRESVASTREHEDDMIHPVDIGSLGGVLGGFGNDAGYSELSQGTFGRLSRSTSIARSGTVVSRAATIRGLGQLEANKRNKAVKIVIEGEEPARPDSGHSEARDFPKVDISSYASDPAGLGFLQTRKTTMRSARVEIIHPQPNWKPFSMRWPYLISLIVTSTGLAIAQEFLYQKSREGPLYSFTTPDELSTWSFFTFKYLPTIVAVTFGILWQLSDFEVKRLEVYYQLSRPDGALAAESINVDYITFFNFLRPLRAVYFRHYAVATCSLATLLAVSLVPTLQTATVELLPDKAIRTANANVQKEIRINETYSRILTVVLSITAALGCLLVWLIESRRSGLTADIKGVAGIAAMANRSHILMDFENMDTASPDAIHKRLKGHRYVLQNSSLVPLEGIEESVEEKRKFENHGLSENPHPRMLRLYMGVIFIIGMFTFGILIPVVLFTPADVVTDRAPWIMTLLAVIIKLIYGTLENNVRVIEPFYRLWCRHQPPNVLTLDYTGMPFGWLPIRAALNRDFLMAAVGLGSVLAEVLTVCVTSLSGVTGTDFLPANRDKKDGWNTGDETVTSFWGSFWLAMVIMLYLCVSAGLVYARRRHAFLPRQPNTVASVLAYIHQSKMLRDFAGTETLDNDDMVRRLAGIGKRYGLGWFVGRDADCHCGVDEEELVTSYKHGADSRAAFALTYMV